MISAKEEKHLRWLGVTIALVLLLLLSESFLPLADSVSSLPSRLFHLLMIVVLIAATAALMRTLRRSTLNSLTDFSREMTEMKREVDKSAWRYKCLLEGAGNAIFVFNVEDGVLEEVNRKASELLGYHRQEIMALKGRDFVAEEEQEQFSSLVMRVLRRGRARSDGLLFRKKNGGVFYGEVDARLIDLGDSRVVHVIVRDITFKWKAQQEVSRKNQELSILVNFMARVNQSLELQTTLDVTLRETIEVLRGDGGIIHLADADGEHFALAATHRISDRLRADLAKCSFSAHAPCIIVDTLHSHPSHTLDTAVCSLGRLAAADGWLSSVAAPLLAQGRLIGVMHVLSGSERRFSDQELTLFSTIGSQIGIVIEHARLFEELNFKTEELLRSYRLLEKSSRQLAVSQRKLNKNLILFEHANHELGRIDKMKSHFLGMISHEFRTPLTGIMSGTEFLLSTVGNLSEEERKILNMIYNGGNRLNEILTDLLRVARLEARSMGMNRTALQLKEVVDLVHDQVEPLLQQRHQTLTLSAIDTLPFFNGDREYLEEVFTKLIENAIKFSPDGGEIVIAGSIADRAVLQPKEDILLQFNPSFCRDMGAACYLQVEVRDSGVGIEAAEQVKIFEKFYEVGEIRHHTSGKHKFLGKGTGLGLAIVKGMVEAHGGMVWVESPSCTGCGSSFFLLLPMEEEVRQVAFPFMQTEALGEECGVAS